MSTNIFSVVPNQIMKLVDTFLDLNQADRLCLGTYGSMGMILRGDSGVGKSFLLKELQKMRGGQRSTILQVDSLISLAPPTCAKVIIKFLSLPHPRDTSHLFLIDDIDKLGDVQNVDVAISSIVEGCRGLMGTRGYIVATCTNADDVPVDILSSLWLGKPLALPPLGNREREEILRSLLCGSETRIDIKREESNPVAMDEASLTNTLAFLAQITQGCTYSDLVQLIRTELLRSESEMGKEVGSGNDTSSIRKTVCMRRLVQSAMELRSSGASLSLEQMKTCEFDSSSNTSGRGAGAVVGLERVQERLLRALRGTLFFQETSKESCDQHAWMGQVLKSRPCTGVLLHGPSGSGKSTLVKWLTYKAGPRFQLFEVPCADLIHKVVGESEKKLRACFQAARKMAPALLVLDNIDIIFGSRSGLEGTSGERSSHPAMDRLLSALLVELDGISSGNRSTGVSNEKDVHVERKREEQAPFIVIATSQSKQGLDGALMRPGRLEEHVELSFPDREQRYRYLHKEITMTSSDIEDEETSEGLEELLSGLVETSHGSSFASLRLLVQEAKQNALKVCISNGSFDEGLARVAFLRHLRKSRQR